MDPAAAGSPVPASPFASEQDVSPEASPTGEARRDEAPIREVPPPDREASSPDDVPDLDLAPRIEALKSFLARYPSERPADEPAVRRASADPSGETEAVVREPAAAERDASPRELFRTEPAVPAQAADWKSGVLVGLLGSRRRRIAVGVTLIAIVAALAFAVLRTQPSASAEATGSLSVGTNPAGIAVLIDGALRGVTPLSVDLPPGDHVIELFAAGGRRQIPVTITAGGQVSQFLELPKVVSELGELSIRTDPARASVTLDGVAVGRSPLTVPDLTPGVHTVVLQHESASVTERVLIESGKTASLVVSMSSAPSPNAAGWISIAAPADVQVFENKRLLGSSSIDRIMLPVGRHELEIVNEALGYRSTQTVEVTAGQVSRIRPSWPQGSLALNAIPWAEVFIDGQSIGETPIGSVSVPIGAHEVLFRHPDLGERRTSVVVTAGKPMRIGVDLTAK